MTSVDLVDLAARRLGGMVLAANDEFFAAKENLLLPGPPTFDPHRYTDRGKEMDGWETRRRRGAGHDWCIVRLGVPGVVRQVLVDTTHFRGNYPEACSIEGHWAAAGTGSEDIDVAEWMPLLGRTPLRGDAVNRFPVEAAQTVTHLRLNIHPDGGVARLRVLGDALPDLRVNSGSVGTLDIASVLNGGHVTSCSEEFFSSRHNLITVGDARDMGDGWETRRRRGPGHDWAVIRLGAPASIVRVELDTTHFKGNYPDRCSVDVCDLPAGDPDGGRDDGWQEVLAQTPLSPHNRHTFDIAAAVPATHVRLNIYPDGGVARLRVHGTITDEGWRRWGTRWLSHASPAQFAREVLECCGSQAWAAELGRQRPFADFDALCAAADDVWWSLGAEDWLEAFGAHPRIGDRTGPAHTRAEQAGTAGAAAGTLQALAEGNRRYEERFGHVFLICATGKSAQEMLTALQNRIDNDPETELRIAAEEQRKITRLRLDALVRPRQAQPGGGAI